MTKLPKNHPFIIEAVRLERLAAQEGISDRIVEGRKKLMEAYPEYYAEFIEAKKRKEGIKKEEERIEKEIQKRERFGMESISYLKNKIEERKRKNREKIKE